MTFSRGKSSQEDPKQLLQHLPQLRRAPACSDTTLCMSPLPLPVCTGRPLVWLVLPDCGPSETCHQCSCNLWWHCVSEDVSLLSAVLERNAPEPAMSLLASSWSAFTPTCPSSHWCCPCLQVRNCQFRETFGVEILLVNATSWIGTYRMCHWT